MIDALDLPGNHADFAFRHPLGPIAPGAGHAEFADRGHIGLARPQDRRGILLYGLAGEGAEAVRVPTSGSIAGKLQEAHRAGALSFKLAGEGEDRKPPIANFFVSPAFDLQLRWHGGLSLIGQNDTAVAGGHH